MFESFPSAKAAEQVHPEANGNKSGSAHLLKDLMLLSFCCIQRFGVTLISLATCQRDPYKQFSRVEREIERERDREREGSCSALMWLKLWYPPSQQTPQTKPQDLFVCVCVCQCYIKAAVQIVLNISEPYVCKLPIITVRVCLFLACNVFSRMDS